ncbi:uncharacterized protein LOC114930547 isoform X3 [Nylanderia fulva]|uniref:uncharacterized protein LOC114930547 isoform X3 n=1 Tax=Nylanderia fulva TaxID=613905 RepID=UPI0010FBB2FE|nr:uncharacterized protein LOC114930547 isoform X3 [Nylanderia fulva]
MDEPISRGGRWVCPNDRHLALRAKLRTGWSVKTGSFESHGWGDYSNSYMSGSNRCGQSFLLTDDERQSIIQMFLQVIQRAEALDLSEQERVGRLVERLDNMKRNVCVVTSIRSNERRGCGSRCSGGARCVCSCALCGEKFGTVLGASANLCKDCRRYICQKCGIEATRLNLPKGNGDKNDANVSSRSSLRLIRIAQERMAVQRIIQRSHGNAQKQFLCRICAETREMWKKSGAWFFKGMPKYILPEKKERGWSRPSHRTSTWTINKSADSTDAQDSSSDDDATRRLAVNRGHSPTNLSSNRESTPTKLTISSPATSTPSPKSPRGRPNGLSPGYRDDAGSDRLDKSCLSIASQCSRLSPTGSIGTPRSKTSGKSPSSQTEQHVSFEDIFVDDEKANEADDDEEENSENASTPKDASTSLDRSKGTQTEDPGDADHAGQAVSDYEQEMLPREKCGTEQVLLGSGQFFQRDSQQQSSQGVKNPGKPERNGTRLWDSRSLLAIRPGRSVPPVQGGTCTSSNTYGHPRPRRSFLQAEYIARRKNSNEQPIANKNGAQNARPGIQRDGEFLRNDGNRYLEWQGIARLNHSGRPIGSGLPGRSEISSTRIATISNETLQSFSAASLSGRQRRGNLGHMLKRTRADSDKPELLYSSTCAAGHDTSRYESPTHGQQRIF